MLAMVPGRVMAQVPQAVQILGGCRVLGVTAAGAVGRVIGRRADGLGWVSARAWTTWRTPWSGVQVGGRVSGTSSHLRRRVGQGCPCAICMGGAPFASEQVCRATCGPCGGGRSGAKGGGGPVGPCAARSQDVGGRWRWGPSSIRLRFGSCSGEGPGRKPVTFWVLGNNLAGAAHQRDIVGPLIEAVDPSFVMLQETWDPTAAQALVPPTYALVQGAVTGQGRGLAVGIRLADILPMHPPAVVYASRDWLGVLCHARHVGRVLLLDAHFDPHASHAQWRATMDNLLTCAHHVRAAVTIIEGDLNSTDDGAAPLAVTLRRDPRLQSYVRVLPPRMPTNFVSIQGRIRATAIDHLFISGPVRSSEHHLVPTASSHLAVLADISLTSTRYAPFH